ncbi:MAG TPA: DUF2971 domain-containing protein [Bryobacteraceae bacterium]
MEQLHRTAFQNDIALLYHYEKFNLEYLATILQKNIIHCSDPKNLNDPWDCKPVFDPHALDDPEILEREIAWRQEHPDKHLWAAKMRSDPEFRVSFMINASPPIEAMLARRRIYCLTPKPDSTLIWSHYAENHRGICLEFSTSNPLFRRACEVIYQKEYPRWAPCDIHENPGRVMELILTKSSDWLYEQEYRLVSIETPAPDFLYPIGDFFRLPDGALKSVIIGCEADQRTIAEVVRKCAPSLPIKQAVRTGNLYTLTIADYS